MSVLCPMFHLAVMACSLKFMTPALADHTTVLFKGSGHDEVDRLVVSLTTELTLRVHVTPCRHSYQPWFSGHNVQFTVSCTQAPKLGCNANKIHLFE